MNAFLLIALIAAIVFLGCYVIPFDGLIKRVSAGVCAVALIVWMIVSYT